MADTTTTLTATRPRPDTARPGAGTPGADGPDADGAGSVSTVAAASARVGDPVALGAVSPAAHLTEAFTAAAVSGDRGVTLREVPFVTMVAVQVARGSDVAAGVEQALGLLLPERCGQVSAGDGASVLWFGPGEFLVVADGFAPELPPRLVAPVEGLAGAVVDVSANRTTLELSGPSARLVLEKGCPADLHPRSFPVGTAILTRVGSVNVALWRVADDTWRLLPRSSFADHLGRWLVDAMGEFGARRPGARGSS
ncbi:sarcosine oxidase subunit gamma [Terracoccus luteus]|uniref:Sarcosine oxidase subunit gamma n=1 Tax=Terracoccus luteus TaxID=53356 RepID=A0A495XYE6_9MICO|nr:sarcosine oxidase subunit gamma family protein [Terracoccus luteus]RKT79631.1 sarcosine oxidase subunit gamma [Terracoccus luteus]